MFDQSKQSIKLSNHPSLDIMLIRLYIVEASERTIYRVIANARFELHDLFYISISM